MQALQETGHISATVLEKKVPLQVYSGMIRSKQSTLSGSPLHLTRTVVVAVEVSDCDAVVVAVVVAVTEHVPHRAGHLAEILTLTRTRLHWLYVNDSHVSGSALPLQICAAVAVGVLVAVDVAEFVAVDERDEVTDEDIVDVSVDVAVVPRVLVAVLVAVLVPVLDLVVVALDDAEDVRLDDTDTVGDVVDEEDADDVAVLDGVVDADEVAVVAVLVGDVDADNVAVVVAVVVAEVAVLLTVEDAVDVPLVLAEIEAVVVGDVVAVDVTVTVGVVVVHSPHRTGQISLTRRPKTTPPHLNFGISVAKHAESSFSP